MKSYLILCAILTSTLALPAPAPTPPNIPSAATARSQLAALPVAPQGPQTGYSRSLFPHWITQSGSCNTREVVLKRDGTNVVQSSTCAATSGSWFSPYEGATWTAASDVDIDHMVPLSNAWKVCSLSIPSTGLSGDTGSLLRNDIQSGAASWTTSKRQQFANDLSNPQLIAVTDNVNQAKGDQGPESWKPPLVSYHCTYAKMWVAVKYIYSLTITSAEKSALSGMLGLC